MSQKIELFELAVKNHAKGDWYCGLDFANDIKKFGVCLIRDDVNNKTLTAYAATDKPPSFHGTMGLTKSLLQASQVLEPRGNSLLLPSGRSLNQASRQDLDEALGNKQLIARLRDAPAEFVRDPLGDLLAKMGFLNSRKTQDIQILWYWLFDSVSMMARPTLGDHNEASYIEFMVWLIKQIVTDGKIRLTGVDCPFGACVDFQQVLSNAVPDPPVDPKLKERRTEKFWSRRLENIWQTYGCQDYFHTSRHLKTSAGLEIVPECLFCLLKTIGAEGLEAARRGESDAVFVEAAPRVFLYSIVERIRQAEFPTGIPNDVAIAIRDYKKNEKVEAAENRKVVFNFLKEYAEHWTGTHKRQIKLKFTVEELADNDHLFDAWLSALTAWAHANDETLTHQTAAINEDIVATEGHILALR